MSITFVGRIIATAIEPGAALPYEYTAGESISANDVVCKSETDGKILKANASSRTTMPAFGVAIQSKSEDETIQVIQIGMVVNIARTEDFSFDDAIYVSTESGKATKTSPGQVGNLVQRIGRALSASDIILSPDALLVEIKEL